MLSPPAPGVADYFADLTWGCPGHHQTARALAGLYNLPVLAAQRPEVEQMDGLHLQWSHQLRLRHHDRVDCVPKPQRVT